MTAPAHPPDMRLDGPVHTWFGLSYSQYQVLNRTLMQSMPIGWQQRMVACLTELHDAFAHLDRPGGIPQPSYYIVEPAMEREYGDLTADEMDRLGVTGIADPDHPNDDDDDDLRGYEDRDGIAHEAWERVLVPVEDRIPGYNRGRTYIEPQPPTDPDGAHIRVRWFTLGGHIHTTVWSTERGGPDTTHGNNGRLIFRPAEFDLWRTALEAHGIEFIEDRPDATQRAGA